MRTVYPRASGPVALHLPAEHSGLPFGAAGAHREPARLLALPLGGERAVVQLDAQLLGGEAGKKDAGCHRDGLSDGQDAR